MARRKKPTLVGLPNNDDKYNGKFKTQEVFVPDGNGGVWRVVHDTCVDCGERFIQIRGDAMGQAALFPALEQIAAEQLHDFVGNGAIKFCLELNAKPRAH